jgi:SAM-dependent methyltransferase
VRATGSSGKVYEVEIERDWLDYLEARAAREGLTNIETVQGGSADLGLPMACCDVNFLCNTYYMIADRVGYLKHLAGRLRPAGRIVIIDWLKRPLPRGPSLEYKLTTQQVRSELRQAGLAIDQQPEFLPWQYFFIAAVSH